LWVVNLLPCLGYSEHYYHEQQSSGISSKCWFHFLYIQKALELLNHMAVVFSKFFEKPTCCFFLVTTWIYMSTNNIQKFTFLCILSNPLSLGICLSSSHPDRLEVILHCDFDMRVPEDSRAEHLF
jgi:hypothetical protein